MRLSKQLIDLIQGVLKTARTLKLDSIAIEQEQIRAMNDSQTVSVLEKQVPDLEFTGLGIGRVSVLQSRLAMMEGEDYYIEATLLPNGVVRQLDIVSDSTKFEYRCANPTSIKAPRGRKDADLWSFTINEKTVNMLSKACSSVAAEDVTIRSNSKGEMLMTIVDGTTSDKFTQRFDAEMQNLMDDDGDLQFEFRYLIDIFLLALKSSEADKKGNIEVIVTESGAIRTMLNNNTVYIIPLADETDTDD